MAEEISSEITVNATEAAEFIVMCFHARLTVYLSGPPGVGKSDIFRQIAKKYRLYLIDLRLSQLDPVDLNGFGSAKGDRGTYLPMDIFPLEGDPLPAGYKGFLLFLDELPSAPLAVQAAGYKVALDHMVGNRKLHPKTFVAAAGNRVQDGAIVNRLGTAMQSRLAHLTLRVAHEPWLQWASENGIDSRITSWIHHKPTALHDFKPDHNDKTFACPRTWEFASRLLKVQPNMQLRDKLPILAGTIGQGAARAFVSYCDVYKDLVSYADIKRSAKTLAVPQEPAMLAATAGMIGSNVTAADLPDVMPYIYRLPLEHQTFAMRDACRRNPKLRLEEPVVEWLDRNVDHLTLF
jgi:hypothetical protein